MSNLETQTEQAEQANPFVTAANQGQSEDSVVETQTEVKKQSEPIYLGGKKFSSVEELAQYTEQLETERSIAAAKASNQVAPPKKVSDLIFEDPEKALELHEQQIIQKLRAEEQAKQSEKQWWDGFYTKNKDLSEDQDLVAFTLNKHWDELRTLHPDQASDKLADYTRKTAVRFRKTAGEKQELPSGQAKVGPGTTYNSPKVQESKPAPVDFVTQMKKIQSKRK